MSLAANFYPPTPADVTDDVTRPSASFKREVMKVMSSIVLFMIVYLLLMILSVILVAACVYAGIMLIVNVPKFITIMIGIGLIGLGVLVFFFLIKFIFAVSKVDQAGNIQVKEADQPELFAFIRQLTRDTQTPFPRKIFLTPEVNAAVFYNSSFFSMFFPVKKNLQIGLGLVNSLNLSEFKAVMAHEFGHFSQRSMKLGSFVYNVNRVIYNMLFENRSYGAFIGSWANVSGYFAFFAGITVKIVQGIQWILGRMYGVINKNYMSLSREMEFHADAVAASVSGSEHCINALRRIEVADLCYNTVISKYNEWYKDNIAASNFYPDHRLVLLQFAKEHCLETENQLPVIHSSFLQTINQSRVNYKDQWASHPARQEREKKLEELNVKGQTINESAWVLFRDIENLQQQLTGNLYINAPFSDSTTKIDAQQFAERLYKEETFYSFQPDYNGFYTGRNIKDLSFEALCGEAVIASFTTATFNDIFSQENTGLIKKIRYMESDIAILKAIADKNITAKSFDFDGAKYEQEDARSIMERLEAELVTEKERLADLDKKAFCFFYWCALKKGADATEELKTLYGKLFSGKTEDELFYADTNALIELIRPFYEGGLTEENVSYIISQLKSADEVKFKQHLKRLLDENIFQNIPAIKDLAEKFNKSNYRYFVNGQFFQNEFTELNELIAKSADALSEYRFLQFKNILEKQLEMYRALN